MTSDTFESRPLAAHRRAVLGCLIGTGTGAALVALVFAFDVGALAAEALRTGSLTLLDLALLPVTFGLLGLVLGPAIGRGRGSAAS